MSLRVGTLVMVVRTGTELDGATGTITDREQSQLGWCPWRTVHCVGYGYGVELSRRVAGSSRWWIGRQNLVPLGPPDNADDELALTPIDAELLSPAFAVGDQVRVRSREHLRGRTPHFLSRLPGLLGTVQEAFVDGRLYVKFGAEHQHKAVWMRPHELERVEAGAGGEQAADEAPAAQDAAA